MKSDWERNRTYIPLPASFGNRRVLLTVSTCSLTQTSSQQVKFVIFVNRLPLSQISQSPKRSCSHSLSLMDVKLIHSTDSLTCLLDANHSINIYARSVFETQMNNISLDLKEFLSDRGDEKITVIGKKRWATVSFALMSI